MIADERLRFILNKVPVGASERWTKAECDCDSRPEPHINEYLVVDGLFLCMIAPDDDGVVFKWQIVLIEDGSGRVANGWGHTEAECRSQAEMTARALSTDRMAYYERNPDKRPVNN